MARVALSLQLDAPMRSAVGKWGRSLPPRVSEGLRDATRSGRPPKHDAETRRKVQTRVCQQPDEQSRRSVRTLAGELGLPASTVRAMLVAAKLQPHRSRTFTFSPDPDLEAKLLDIVGLYRHGTQTLLAALVPGLGNGLVRQRGKRYITPKLSPRPQPHSALILHA